MGDTSETNTKVLYRELFLGVVALKPPIPQTHYLRDKVPFLTFNSYAACMQIAHMQYAYILHTSCIEYSSHTSCTHAQFLMVVKCAEPELCLC